MTSLRPVQVDLERLPGAQAAREFGVRRRLDAIDELGAVLLAVDHGVVDTAWIDPVKDELDDVDGEHHQPDPPIPPKTEVKEADAEKFEPKDEEHKYYAKMEPSILPSPL